MAQLLNEPIRAEHDPAGRLTAYEWRGTRYAVDAVLKTYGSAQEGRVYRFRVTGAEGVAVVELGRDEDRWRLRARLLGLIGVRTAGSPSTPGESTGHCGRGWAASRVRHSIC
ncbi:hypothetical protein AB0H37_25585 [Actinomadura sp. NPDC023710]|uniref:hypothetical protein n=1 Tax=Actinomadura sp. NPDC023710 TaxID=3158219 RepID=UPI0033E221CE